MTTALPTLSARLLGPADTLLGASGNSLQNCMPDLLPSGALCFVNSEDSLYRLAKFSDEALDGTRVIATARGSAARGRWVQMTGTAAIAPLPTLLFVDSMFEGTPTGSIAAPFPTLQDAIDAVPLATGGTIMVTSGPTYPDPWVVPEDLTVDIYGAGNIQGGPGGNVTIGAGTLSDDAHVRLQDLGLSAEITLIGSGTLFCWNVSFNMHDVLQSGPGGWILRLSGDGIADSNPRHINTLQLAAQNINFNGNITVSGTFARLFYCIVEGNVTFTGAAGSLLTDLFTLNTMRGHAASVVNGTPVATDAPTSLHTITSPVFGAAGVQSVSVLLPFSAPGDTFAITNRSALPANVSFGAPHCDVAGTVVVEIAAVDASPGGNVDISLTRFNGGL